MKDLFPDARDLEEQVKGGWNSKKIAVDEWDTNGHYGAIVQVVKDVAEQNKAIFRPPDSFGPDPTLCMED